MDFVHDQLATERKLRILTVVDTYSRYCPVIDPRFSYRGEDVVNTLERVCSETGYPRVIRVDQGTEFVSRDMDLWAYQKGVILDFSRPGKPTDNAFIEAFNGRLRAECLNTHWFMSMPASIESRRQIQGPARGALHRLSIDFDVRPDFERTGALVHKHGEPIGCGEAVCSCFHKQTGGLGIIDHIVNGPTLGQAGDLEGRGIFRFESERGGIDEHALFR